jgi:hypothetical protein
MREATDVYIAYLDYLLRLLERGGTGQLVQTDGLDFPRNYDTCRSSRVPLRSELMAYEVCFTDCLLVIDHCINGG